MRLITRNELAVPQQIRPGRVTQPGAECNRDAKQGSPEWLDAMESLDNIRQEQATRYVTPRPRGPGF